MLEQLNRMRMIAERHANGARHETIIPRVALHIGGMKTKPTPNVYEPALCLVLQGAKQAMIGDRLLRYDPASYFIATIELPASGWVVEATPAKPYIAVSMRLDRECLSSLIPDMPPASEGQTRGFAISAVTPDLLDAWSRLLSLLDTPQDVPVLAPMHEREVLYRRLKGPQGGALRQIARVDSRLSQVRHAIVWIRSHFNEMLRVEQLAEQVGMSPASFHRHFKAATAMSPLQYQKMLRLQEARRLLIASADAARAAYAVGYESPSQFSREYARMFGAPPARDAERLRGRPIANGGHRQDGRNRGVITNPASSGRAALCKRNCCSSGSRSMTDRPNRLGPPIGPNARPNLQSCPETIARRDSSKACGNAR